MSLVRGFKRLCAPLICSSLLLAFGPPSVAAGAVPSMKPFLRLGPAQAQVASPDGTPGPQYGLFGCQVVGASAANCLDPYQMRTAYKLDSLVAAGYDGTGQTIVIVDAFSNPYIVDQVAAFNAFYGLPATKLTTIAPDGLTPFDVSDANMVGWAEEISLDVEWAHAIAPGAKIVLVLAKSNSDADLVSALKYAVDNHLGDVISMSFGENESCVGPDLTAAYHQVFADATKKNISLFASSADQGAALSTCDGTSWVKAVSSPAVDPLVTSVGGTELTVAKYCLASRGCVPSSNPAPGTYQSEVVWNEGLPYGDYGNVFGYGTLSGGGGFSIIYPLPPYQKGTLPHSNQRALPDVSYSGSVEHGVLTFLDGRLFGSTGTGVYLFGGTSAGAPQWAAIASIANQKAGHDLGFLNAAIYRIGLSTAAATSLHDITIGTNSSLQFDAANGAVDISGYSAGPGWDAASGAGSPIGASMVDQLVAQYLSGDGQAAISTTKAKPMPKPLVPGKAHPH